MKLPSLRDVATEARLLLIGIPVFLWTMIPIYHMFLFAISERDSATSGRLWPKNPTLQNFDFVFHQKHFYLDHFWRQLGNSLVIAIAAFFAAAISAVVEFGPAGSLSEFAQSPAPSAFSFWSPMWSPCAWLSRTT